MLALAMRQAGRKGAIVVVADPRPVFLPFEFTHFVVAPRTLDAFSAEIVREAMKESAAGLQGKAKSFYESLPAGYAADRRSDEKIKDLGGRLAAAERPVIICGTDLPGESTVHFASGLAHLLQERIQGAGVFYVLPGSNAFGAGVLSSEEPPGSIVEAIESGHIKALVLVEQDPFHAYPSRERLGKALQKLEFLLVLDFVQSPAAAKANIVIPTATHFESNASFANQEGRVQPVTPVYRGGAPISMVSGGGHPPRTFLEYVPGLDPRASHEILSEIYGEISGRGRKELLEGLWDWIAEELPIFKDMTSTSDGHRLLPGKQPEDRFSSYAKQPASRNSGLELLLVDWTFGTEELSSYSQYTREAEAAPRFFMHPLDAARLGIADGGKIALELEAGELTADVAVVSNMAAGMIIVPRHRQLEWQKMGKDQAVLHERQIRKV
jgi:anaerobic selenocysteine-containing dehydrogenase